MLARIGRRRYLGRHSLAEVYDVELHTLVFDRARDIREPVAKHDVMTARRCDGSSGGSSRARDLVRRYFRQRHLRIDTTSRTIDFGDRVHDHAGAFGIRHDLAVGVITDFATCAQLAATSDSHAS